MNRADAIVPNPNSISIENTSRLTINNQTKLNQIISQLGKFSIHSTFSIKEVLLNQMSSVRNAPANTIAHQEYPAEDDQMSDKFVEDSCRVLVKANTVFPFTFFPSSIVVDRSKVTIIQRTFFLSANIISLRIEDILNVSSSVGPLFGSISITTRVMNTIDHFDINYFKRKDAIFLKHIIQGFSIAIHKHKNIDQIPDDKLVTMLEELGQDYNQ